MKIDPLKAILLSVDKLNILVVGFGKIGRRKAKSYIDSGAWITVVDPKCDPSVRSEFLSTCGWSLTPPYAIDNKIDFFELTFDDFIKLHETTFLKQHLVLICSDSKEVNQRVQEVCDFRSKLYNRTDDFSKSTFSDMIQYADERQIVAVSGRGISPYVSKYLMENIQPLVTSKAHQDRVFVLSSKSHILKKTKTSYESIRMFSTEEIERIGNE